MAEVHFNSNGLSSRENKLLKVFQKLDSDVISTETLRQLTGYDQKVLHKTIEKLQEKGYIQHATTAEVKFFKPDRNKLEKVLSE